MLVQAIPLPEGILGCYDARSRTVVIDPRLIYRQARSTLAHELVHAEYDDEPVACRTLEAKRESWVEREAARRLIRAHELVDAIRWCGEDRRALAEHLDVDDAMLDVRLASLHPAELGYVRRCLG